jgi:hypothetical protein
VESGSHDLTGLAWKSAAVAVAAFMFLAYPVERTGIAAAYSNPVDRIHAQDESVYADASLHTAKYGNWLTPITMGRIYLGKPPLLYIFTGLSFKLFGTSLFALRLPCMLAGAITVALLFAWGARLQNVWTGLLAALLLLSNPVWDTFARLCYTDMLLTFFSAAAMFSLARDPTLEDPMARWGFILSDAAAILSKSLAGILPVVALVLLTVILRRSSFMRVFRTLAWIALLAAPWHVYQFIVHSQWFWTDYIKVQMFVVGVQPPGVDTPENTLWFYGKRLFATDPLMCILAALTLPALVIDLKYRKPKAWVPASWLGVILLAILAFRWRSFSYALMLLAPLCLIAACYTPKRLQPWVAGVAGLFLAWTVTYPMTQPLAAAPALRSYLERGRSNELILVDTDDEFYSATLPLPKVRYVFRDPEGATVQLMPHYVDLGITVTADQFNDLPRWEPAFRERLSAWHSGPGDSIATTIVAKTDADVVRIIESHPNSDFYLPSTLTPAPTESHSIERVSPDRVLLLSRHSARIPVPAWPQNW